MRRRGGAPGRRGRRRPRGSPSRRSCTSAIERMRSTESASARCGSLAPAARSRSSDATVCRLFLTRWWISWATMPRITPRPDSTAVAAWWATDSSSVRSSRVKRPRPALVQTSAPMRRAFHTSGTATRPRVVGGRAAGDRQPARRRPAPRARSGARPSRPSGASSTSAQQFGVGRAWRAVCDDRRQRLLLVQRLRHRLGDAGQRLELGDAPLRALVEAGVLDGLRDLRGDRRRAARPRRRRTRAGCTVRTFIAPSRRSRRSTIGTASSDWKRSSGRFGNALKRGSRCASLGDRDGLAHGARRSPSAPRPASSAAAPWRSPGSCRRRPCRTSSPAASS